APVWRCTCALPARFALHGGLEAPGQRGGLTRGELGSLATCAAVRAWLLGIARDPHRRWLGGAARLVPVARRAARSQAPVPRPRASDGRLRPGGRGRMRSGRGGGVLPGKGTLGD